MNLDVTNLKIVLLSSNYDLSEFDCGDIGLNEFLKHDSFYYQDNCFARTFLALYNNEIIGFFSLVNDSIKLKEDEKENLKNLSEYPSVKIARLAIDKRKQGLGFGKLLIKIALGIILECKHGASRFIVVDSYQNNLGFYEKLGFVSNLHKHYVNKEDYVSMRFDFLNPQQT